MNCNIPVCIHIVPALSKKLVDCNCITEVKTMAGGSTPKKLIFPVKIETFRIKTPNCPKKLIL